jgi:hypothetical protein
MWEVLGREIGRWGDYQVEEDERVNHRWLAMPEERWQEYCRRQIRYAKNVNAAMRWVDRMNTKRRAYIPAQPTPDPIRYTTHEPLHVKFLVLQDYVDEPWKYGDEVCETIALEEELKQTPKAWRVHAMWLRKEEEEKQQEEKDAEARAYESIVKFQALVRGHQTRCRNGWTSCAHCLCHRVSTWWAGDETRPVCEDCYNQIRQNLKTYSEFDAPMF